MKLTNLIIVSGLSLLLVSQSFAGPGRKGGGCKMHRGVAQELGLTDEEMIKLEEMRLDHKKAMLKFKPEMKRIRTAVKDELLAESPDKAKLSTFADEMGKLHAEMAKVKQEHLLDVKATLTPEQFEKLLNSHGPDGAMGGRRRGAPGCGKTGHPGCTHR